jgi:hypothetical protein
VKSSCHTVQLASEDFAVQNNGVYAADLADVTPSGETIIGLLPGGILMDNPFTKAATEPVDAAATQPGETGYVVIDDGSGTHVGYTITGYGKDALIITLSSGS